MRDTEREDAGAHGVRNTDESEDERPEGKWFEPVGVAAFPGGVTRGRQANVVPKEVGEEGTDGGAHVEGDGEPREGVGGHGGDGDDPRGKPGDAREPAPESARYNRHAHAGMRAVSWAARRGDK